MLNRLRAAAQHWRGRGKDKSADHHPHGHDPHDKPNRKTDAPSPVPTGDTMLGSYETIGKEGKRSYDVQHDAHIATLLPAVTLPQAQKLLEAINTKAAEATQHFADDGSTGSFAVVTEDKQLLVHQVGDSPIALYMYDGETGKFSQKIFDQCNHSLTNENEKARVIQAGGRIWTDPKSNTTYVAHLNADGSLKKFLKEQNGITVETFSMVQPTRGFGDRAAKGVISEAEYTNYNLNNHLRHPNSRVWLVVASDGLHQFPSINSFKAAITNEGRDTPQKLAEAFTHYATDKIRSKDNITVTVAEIGLETQQSLFLGVMDGHGDKGHEVSATVKDVAEREITALGMVQQPPAAQPRRHHRHPSPTGGHSR